MTESVTVECRKADQELFRMSKFQYVISLFLRHQYIFLRFDDLSKGSSLRDQTSHKFLHINWWGIFPDKGPELPHQLQIM